MEHHESRLVINGKITGELEGAVALGPVYEDGDCRENVADGQLAAMKDRAGRDAVLLAASLALIHLAGFQVIGLTASTFRAHRLAIGLRPADLTKSRPGFRVRHAHDIDQREGLGGGRKEKML